MATAEVDVSWLPKSGPEADEYRCCSIEDAFTMRLHPDFETSLIVIIQNA